MFKKLVFILVLLLITKPAMPKNTKNKPNRLINEQSPYLLQHAYNPVDWYPWGEEAIQRAKKENKPIFLSIGYSTCHWCHVIEKESFSNKGIADTMNKLFVCIKVDREERPDIDTIYMTAVQAMTGSGGWPLNVWLTPNLKPIFGGTYFPVADNYGLPTFPDVLKRVDKLWQKDKDNIMQTSSHNLDQILDYMNISAGNGKLDRTVLDKTFNLYKENYDTQYGGFGNAPKFSMPVNHQFLMHYFLASNNSHALTMSLKTLSHMAEGGIFDQIGGGFHRYSTDRMWHIPHFEKMLYDNAQLISVFLDAYLLSNDLRFKSTAQETIEYILRDMTHADGGFFSAEDADSLPEHGTEKKEGAFYIWEKEEIMRILGKNAGEIVSFFYGIESEGNAQSDPYDEFKIKNILYKASTVNDTAKEFKRNESEIREILNTSKTALLNQRSKRSRPYDISAGQGCASFKRTTV